MSTAADGAYLLGVLIGVLLIIALPLGLGLGLLISGVRQRKRARESGAYGSPGAQYGGSVPYGQPDRQSDRPGQPGQYGQPDQYGQPGQPGQPNQSGAYAQPGQSSPYLHSGQSGPQSPPGQPGQSGQPLPYQPSSASVGRGKRITGIVLLGIGGFFLLGMCANLLNNAAG